MSFRISPVSSLSSSSFRRSPARPMPNRKPWHHSPRASVRSARPSASSGSSGANSREPPASWPWVLSLSAVSASRQRRCASGVPVAWSMTCSSQGASLSRPAQSAPHSVPWDSAASQALPARLKVSSRSWKALAGMHSARGLDSAYRTPPYRPAHAGACVDRAPSPPIYSPAMSSEKARALLDQELKRLEARVQELVTKVGKLDGENGSLRDRLESLTSERASLLAKNDEVRSRVE